MLASSWRKPKIAIRCRDFIREPDAVKPNSCYEEQKCMVTYSTSEGFFVEQTPILGVLSKDVLHKPRRDIHLQAASA